MDLVKLNGRDILNYYLEDVFLPVVTFKFKTMLSFLLTLVVSALKKVAFR